MMKKRNRDGLDAGTFDPSDRTSQKIVAEFPVWAAKLRGCRLYEKATRIWEKFRAGGLSRTHLSAVAGALLYCLSPIDLTPDAIPVIGLVDDFLVAVSVLAYLEGHD
jgi:uncharacterized membrane protein YkvA (DUF1232 family)